MTVWLEHVASSKGIDSWRYTGVGDKYYVLKINLKDMIYIAVNCVNVTSVLVLLGKIK
jgi:hypothetical protein